MAKFKDSKGREWEIEITIGTTMRLKKEGINFHELAENKCAKFVELETDDEAFAPLLWAIIKPQADVLNVDAEEFFNSLYGEFSQSAWEAFAAAYINFTRSPAIRSVLQEAFARSKRMQEQAAKTLQQKMDRMEELGRRRMETAAAAMDDAKLTAILDGAIANRSAQPTPSEASGVLLAS